MCCAEEFGLYLINDQEPLSQRQRNDMVKLEFSMDDCSEYWYCSGDCFKGFANNPQDNLVSQGLLSAPFYRWGNGGIELQWLAQGHTDNKKAELGFKAGCSGSRVCALTPLRSGHQGEVPGSETRSERPTQMLLQKSW